MGEYKDEKILIFISSVMVWSNTPLKEKVTKDTFINIILNNSIQTNTRKKEKTPQKQNKKKEQKSLLAKTKKKIPHQQMKKKFKRYIYTYINLYNFMHTKIENICQIYRKRLYSKEPSSSIRDSKIIRNNVCFSGKHKT